MRPPIALAALIAAPLALPMPIALAQAPETSTVFSSGDAGVNTYRIPGLVVTPKGTVLAYAEARRDGVQDWGEIEVHLRRSTDGGKTWGQARHIAHQGDRIEGNPTRPEGGEHEQTVNNPVAIVDHTAGTIEFLYCVNYARCFSIRSADDGLTWSRPKEITATFEPFRARYDWKVIATGPGHGIQCADGRLAVPVWLAYGREGAHSPAVAATIFSDDHGETWQAGEIAVPGQGEFSSPNESMLAQTSDGGVIMITRSPSRANRKIVTTSKDGISDWSVPRFHPELWEPICMSSLLALPDHPGTLLYSGVHNLARDPDGNELPGRQARRINLSIRLSRDDGETWPTTRTLVPGPSGYSDLAILPDGTLLCLYEAGKDDYRESIRLSRFGLSWLTEE